VNAEVVMRFVFSEMSRDVVGSGHQSNVWEWLGTCRGKTGCEETEQAGKQIFKD